MSDVRARFARETAEHEMTVLHDDGLYRHLHFRRPGSSMYWFDLITVPGTLVFQGDGDAFTFRRIEDMFDFFRGPVGRINPGYWAEKVTDGRDRLMKYDQGIFEARVKETFVEAARNREVPPGTGKALRRDVLDQDIHHEHDAHEALADFEHKGFKFFDTWEWDLRDYDWWFLWALHGIVWGIAQYDAARAAVEAAPPAALALSGDPS